MPTTKVNHIPLVSVLLPVYNAESFLKEAIQSVLNQTFIDFELIILNDGSTDKSKEIINEFKDPRIRYIENETNIRLIRTLNKGIELAQGKYIARMDADDVCMPDRFQKQVNFLEENQEYVMCGTWARIMNDRSELTGRVKRIDTNELVRANMLFTTPFLHPTVMIRREALQTEKYKEEALHCEDLELWIRLANNEQYKFANIPEYLLKYRWHSTNISVQHAEFQLENRGKYILPFVEHLSGELQREDLTLHFMSYQPKEQLKLVSPELLKKAKKWLIKLSKKNQSKQLFRQNDLDALLLSRWWVICIRTKRLTQLTRIPFTWYNPEVVFKAIKLLLYK